MHAINGNDLEELRRLKARYFRYVDTKDWEKLRLLYAANATFDGFAFPTSSVDEFVEGISSYLAGIRTVHQGFMPEFSEKSRNTVRAIWAMQDFLFWEPGTRGYKGILLEGQWGIHGFGHYEEEYIRSDQGWQISFQRLTRLHVNPLAPNANGSSPDYEFARLTPGWID